MEILSLALIGALAGVMAGLLGIGGGLLIVPVLAILFDHQGINPAILMQCAIGTSLATIMFTSLSSIRAHQKHKAIRWPVFLQITPGIVIGGLIGAAVAGRLPGRALHYIVAVSMLVVAVQMAFGRRAADATRELPGRIGIGVAGFIIGALSTLVGIGGGSLTVPFLTWCSVPARQAIATAAAIGFPIALSGAVGYVINGMDAPGRLPWSLGYVVLPAFAGIVVASMLFAPVGARLAHRLSEMTLRRIFATFLVILGTRMLLT